MSADRPACYKLLPSKTLAYVRIADINELGERFNETSIGRMAQQQALKSLTQQLYEDAEQAFAPVAEEIGLTISDLLAIPQGELTLAVTAPPQGLPAPILMVDIGGQEANAKRLLDVLERQLIEQSNLRKGNETIQGTRLTVFAQDDDPRFTGVIHFQKDGLLVMTSNLDVAKQILAAWDGDDEQAILEDNVDFAEIMRHSKGPREATPQIRWFVDPVSFAKVAFRGNFGAQTALAMLPVIGVDGLLAVGGSITLASAEYDVFVQTHFITADPRRGALAALAMKSGDPTPEDWVPHDAASYTTLYWDFDKTRREVQVLYDSFRGEDAFQNDVLNRATEALGVDVLEKVVGAMAGRASLVTWYPKPTRINGIAFLGGVEFKADSRIKETVDNILEHTDPNLESKTYAGSTIYFRPSDDEFADGGEADPLEPISNQPSFAVVGDYLLMASRPEYIERAIVSRSNSSKSLEKELDFKLIASKARRLPGGRSPGMFSFQRPEEGLRMVYELATAESTRNGLANAAEDNPFLSRLNQALEDNPPPPFATLRKFLAPTGSIMTADDHGFHYIGFGLRRK